MKNLTGKQFLNNGVTFTVGALREGTRSYDCTSADGTESLVFSSRALNKLIGAVTVPTEPAPPPIDLSEPLSEERCLEQIMYLLSMTDVCSRDRIVQTLAVEVLHDKVA